MLGVKTDVLIVGAGPTGLTAANLLARSGASFRIIDKKSGPVEETRALVMHAKTLELLDRLGLAERAVEEGRRLGAAELLKEGKRAGKLSFFDDGQAERTPYPFALVYEQDRTERLLIRGLEEAGGGVEWGTELLSMVQSPDGVRAAIRHPDGSEETIEAVWVVGADGASSPVRHSLGLSFEGGTYEETLFLADVEMESGLDPRQAHIDLTREGFYGFFPMPGERRFRLVGSVPEELRGREEITAGDVQGVLDRHSGLETRITAARWTSVYRVHRRMTERFRVGRVFLVGDAAHIHSPAGGQGMNTGIGDAYNLGWKLALVAKGQARESLLDSYEAERMPFARAILNGSDRGFSLQVTTNPVAQGPKLFAVPLLFRLVSLIPPIRRRAFWLISQLWTSYGDSPAVAESGPARGGPKAGDRAPYGFFEAGPNSGTSLFDLLRGPDHHLLLFEGREPGRELDALREELEALLDRYAATAVVHPVPAENEGLHERYGARTPTLFLVRPDGHVAYRGPAADVVGLEAYLERLFVRRGTTGRPPHRRDASERPRSGRGEGGKPMRYATKSAQVLLGLAFLGAGGQKLAGADHMADEFRRYGYPRWSMYATGAVEAGGALGILLGLRRRALVPAAGLLLSATMVGALATHLRLGDSARDMAPPAALLAMSAAVLAAPRAGRGGAR